MIQRSGIPATPSAIASTAATPGPSTTHCVQTSDLVVTVAGLRNWRGQMCFSLFASEQGFPGESSQAVKTCHVLLQSVSEGGEPSLVFAGLTPGLYAIATFHDENSDGILNRGFLGIPREGFGFSGNPLILMGPPKFQEAAIRVDGDRTTIQIQLKYF